jgi:protein involved in ribonucleotide reduction
MGKRNAGAKSKETEEMEELGEVEEEVSKFIANTDRSCQIVGVARIGVGDRGMGVGAWRD